MNFLWKSCPLFFYFFVCGDAAGYFDVDAVPSLSGCSSPCKSAITKSLRSNSFHCLHHYYELVRLPQVLCKFAFPSGLYRMYSIRMLLLFRLLPCIFPVALLRSDEKPVIDSCRLCTGRHTTGNRISVVLVHPTFG